MVEARHNKEFVIRRTLGQGMGKSACDHVTKLCFNTGKCQWHAQRAGYRYVNGAGEFKTETW